MNFCVREDLHFIHFFLEALKLRKSCISALTQTDLNSRALKGAYTNQMSAYSKFMGYFAVKHIIIKQETSCFTMKY